MTILYISGPMQSSGRADLNYPAFNDMEAKLMARGFLVLNPAKNFGGKVDLPRSVYMRLDFRHVLNADELVMLPGWERSPGARLEAAMALALDMPVRDSTMGIYSKDYLEEVLT